MYLGIITPRDLYIHIFLINASHSRCFRTTLETYGVLMGGKRLAPQAKIFVFLTAYFLIII